MDGSGGWGIMILAPPGEFYRPAVATGTIFSVSRRDPAITFETFLKDHQQAFKA
jgi:hypothetical protein